METSTIREERRARVQQVLSQRMGSVVAVVEAVRRRHNTSAILRSCEAFGLHEVHLVTGGFRPSKGAARGSERWLELHLHQEVEPCLEGLKERGFQIFVADLAEHAHTPLTAPVDQPIAVLFGSELHGVSDAARELADGVVTVPMRGLTESLNVAAAATVILAGVSERRRALVGPDLDDDRQASFYENWLDREDRARQGALARSTLHE